MDNFVNKIREETASIWTLLNDTTIFLLRIKKFDEYEKDIKEWRNLLRISINNTEVKKEIKKNIIELRKSLRLQGYNLKLGSKDIQVFGFRSDDAEIEGFKRLVIVINDDIYYLSGDANHQELMRFLSLKLHVESLYSLPYSQVHSLWYRWKDNVLQICGSDSEANDDFDIFKKYVEENKNKLLKKLKDL